MPEDHHITGAEISAAPASAVTGGEFQWIPREPALHAIPVNIHTAVGRANPRVAVQAL